MGNDFAVIPLTVYSCGSDSTATAEQTADTTAATTATTMTMSSPPANTINIMNYLSFIVPICA